MHRPPGRPRRISHRRRFVAIVTGALAAAAVGLLYADPSSTITPPAAGALVSRVVPHTTCTPASPSGQAMPVGDLPGWRQVFTDDFTTDVPLGSFPAAVAARWGASYPDGWRDTTGDGAYAPSKVVSIARGVMNMHLHTENGVHLVAAPVPTIPGAEGSRGGLRYGRFAIRFRADPVKGYKTAWLLWPDSRNFPHDGEIDFPEGALNTTIRAYLHPHGATSPTQATVYVTNTTYASWHTAVIEWTPERVRFLLDGATIGTATAGIPDNPMRWVLQTETSTNGQLPDESASGNVQIDWVAVYRPAENTVEPSLVTRDDATCAARSATTSLVALRARRWIGLTVDAPAPGAMVVNLTARTGARTIVLAKERVVLAQPGERTVTVLLTAAGRELLMARRAALRANLSVTYTSGAVSGTATRPVIFAPPLRPDQRALHAGRGLAP